jgi:hypothetical protein
LANSLSPVITIAVACSIVIFPSFTICITASRSPFVIFISDAFIAAEPDFDLDAEPGADLDADADLDLDADPGADLNADPDVGDTGEVGTELSSFSVSITLDIA